MRIITDIPSLPARPEDSHKGTFGTVIVVGGSATMIGAPALAATAALRAGAGLAKIAASADVVPFAIVIEPGATGIVFPSGGAPAADALDRADPQRLAVLAVGPGMGQGENEGQLVRQLLDGHRTMVLDADGLNLLAASGQRRHAAEPPLVLTPHPGEFRRLIEPFGIKADPTDPSARRRGAAELARVQHATVVLKGRQTVVSDGESVYVNETGNPSLATAGSGDVLTGLITALIAQAMFPIDAAVLGVYLHGLTADRWRDEHGCSGLTARDLADHLPDTFERVRQQSAGRSAKRGNRSKHRAAGSDVNDE